MNNGFAIEAQNLKKSFGELHAVKGVTFRAERGEILSLLGPNGAGKSTTISMLCGLLHPTRVMPASRAIPFAMPQGKHARRWVLFLRRLPFIPIFRRVRTWCFWGKMYGLRGGALKRRVDEVLDIIGLTDRQKGACGKFSGGMKRRLNIGIALLHKPQVHYHG